MNFNSAYNDFDDYDLYLFMNTPVIIILLMARTLPVLQTSAPTGVVEASDYSIDGFHTAVAEARHVCVQRAPSEICVLRVRTPGVRWPASARDGEHRFFSALHQTSGLHIKQAPECLKGKVGEQVWGDAVATLQLRSVGEQLQFGQVRDTLARLEAS